MHRIIVGVDGSEASLEALRFALGEATLRGGEITAVNAWHVPVVVYDAGLAGGGIDVTEFPRLAESTLHSSLARVGAAESGISVTAVVREGQPADILCELAADADLIVMGSRGLGGFRGLLLGSVSQQVAHFAPCPVVIIPHAVHEPAADAS